jgi:WASH complex subunit strumpellin
MDFLGEDNVCGHFLLQLASRGSIIVAELLRLSEHVPAAFLPDPPPEARVYLPVISDFSYLKNVDAYEENIQNNVDLLELDENFREASSELLERFYILFKSIVQYYEDYVYYLEELTRGSFVQHNAETLMQHPEGKTLMCEVLYYLGVMLLLMDQKLPGYTRERLLVSYYRYKGHSIIPKINEVFSMCRDTGFVPGPGVVPKKRPENYPDEYFARCPLHKESVELIVRHLKDDDIYQQIGAFPSPDHRTAALANQAALLYVTLFFTPNLLKNEKTRMREIADKFFSDNWVVTYFLGYAIDLGEMWAPYPAAAHAITSYTMAVDNFNMVQRRHADNVRTQNKALNHYLKEGVLTDDYILSHSTKLLNTLRECNVTLRWLLLQRRAANKRFGDAACNGFELQMLLQLLMHTAQFEVTLKSKLESLMSQRQAFWDDDKYNAAIRMKELAEYFSGNRPLSRGVQKNESYEKWFLDLEAHVNSLGLEDSNAAARKIQQLVQALEDVEQYHQIEGNLQIKQFLNESRDCLRHMVFIANLHEDIMTIIERVGDFSYAWESMEDFLGLMQDVIRREPDQVLLLKATIVKMSSILNVPLVRVIQANSEDIESVSEYYSKLLVAFVRRVLQVIPQAVFTLLDDISALLLVIKELPGKLKRGDVPDFASMEDRRRLVNLTHQVSVFTQGILGMEKTLVGMIELDPKQLLEDGIRRELVFKISRILDVTLEFSSPSPDMFMERLRALADTLHSLKKSFEYVQDFIGIFGLKLWQEEINRIINFNVDLEASSFMPLKRSFEESENSVPIPKLPSRDQFTTNFSGRLCRQLIEMCSVKTIYVDWMHGWYDSTGREIIGLEVLNSLFMGLGIFGLNGVDSLLSCHISHELKNFCKKYTGQIPPGGFRDTWQELQPISRIPERSRSLYTNLMPTVRNFANIVHSSVLRIGQMQLLRRLISYELNFRGRTDSPILFTSLSAANLAVLNDVHHSEGLPKKDDKLVPELEKYLKQMGFISSFEKIFLKPGTFLERLPLVMALYSIYQLSFLSFDKRVGGLTRKKADGPDGAPLAAGVLTILKQFHSDNLENFFGYLGQYVSTSLASARDPKQLDIGEEILNCVVFIEEIRQLAGLKRSDVESYLPAYIFDNLNKA